MRSPSILLTASAAALLLLAACGSQDQAAATAAEEAAAQNELPLAEEAPPMAQPAPAPAPAPVAAAPKPAAKPAPAAPKPQPVQVVTIPAGTILPMSLATSLTSKTAKVGDPVKAILTENVVVDGKTAIASGTTVAGSVLTVVSGSDKIGGTPMLAVSFERIELPGGQDLPISGEITQKGKSDTARDTVKIVGGTAAGAIIGDQVLKGKNGKIIGGILGGAVGAVAAEKTGTEVEMTEGALLSLVLNAPVEVTK